MTASPGVAIVVGAGHSGLSVAAMLQRAGVEAVVLERGPTVATAWRRRHDSLRLNTERWLSGLPGYSMPREFGRWVSRDDLTGYLEDYAHLHRLNIRFEVEARRIERAGSGWVVHTDSGPLGARRVIVATGLHETPFVPCWPGRPTFGGKVVHAADYRNAAPYAGRSVLVVGTGVSGAEIATELATSGATTTWLAVRTAPYVIRPRVFGVLPPGALAVAAGRVPPAVLDRLTSITARLTVGDLSAFGLPPPRDFFARAYKMGRMPVLDRGFTKAVKAGAIRVVPAVGGFDRGEVVLVDGARLGADAVIAATGYRPNLEPLLGHLGVLDPDGRPRVHGAESPPDAPGLHFVGFRYALAGQFREARQMARALARHAHS